MGLERMLRIYFLQQWYTLADEALEDAIYDLVRDDDKRVYGDAGYTGMWKHFWTRRPLKRELISDSLSATSVNCTGTQRANGTSAPYCTNPASPCQTCCEKPW